MNKLINNISIFTLLVTILVFSLSGVSAGALNCPAKTLTEDSPALFCFYYTASEYEVINPSITTDNELPYSLAKGPFVGQPNTEYSIKIYFDVVNSKEGKHKVTVSQGIYKKTLTLEVVKNPDVNYEVSVSYPTLYTSQKVFVNIELINRTNKAFSTKIKAINLPSALETDLEQKTFILTAESSKDLKITFEYDKPVSAVVNYEVSYGGKKFLIPVVLEKEKMQIIQSPNKITALFALANSTDNTTIIALNIVLFVIAVVLFTMFIGRLGKYIVIKKQNGGRK